MIEFTALPQIAKQKDWKTSKKKGRRPAGHFAGTQSSEHLFELNQVFLKTPPTAVQKKNNLAAGGGVFEEGHPIGRVVLLLLP